MRNAAQRWTFRSAFTVGFALLALLSMSVAFASDGSGQPTGITDEARKMHDLYLLVLAIGAVVFVAVEGALIYALVKYKKRDDREPKQIHGNNVLEVIWTSIPIVIVLILFVFSFIVLVDVEEEAEDRDLTVHVQGFQFSWSFKYELNDTGRGSNPSAQGAVEIIGTGAKEPELVIPVDEPVEFILNSNDVIHSFYVRDFLYKLDIIPGRENSFKVTAREEGTFIGQCAELCGLNHALMRFSLRVVSRAEFDDFLAKQSAGQRAAAAPTN
ncbi:MAG: cytochrome c oxidase subunit II [Dehalococcoidia bacterium]